MEKLTEKERGATNEGATEDESQGLSLSGWD